MNLKQFSLFVKRNYSALLSKDRRSVISAAIDQWNFSISTHPIDRFLVEIFPETRGQAVLIDADVSHWFELPYGERLVIAALLKTFRPSKIFEFGTFTGATTRLMADMAPENAIVHTLDLPDEELSALDKGVDPNIVGQCFTADRKYDGRIISHRANSRRFDFSAFERNVPFVYIDASHAYEDVISDSRQALRMVSNGGLIVWDDYAPNCAGVVQAIQDLGIDILRVRHTRLALHRA